ncbi:PHD and RING finger domain-containing protein isoform 2 [Schistosoma japonicum]|uniref:PHD and RING finger domain-containing protein isoform 2 n=1 Tax=Schistosoma japonicum TaxID=6182 RepID=A0A4Z2D5Y5_SCHJA|nr:Bromodomain adjacent to zinc finger domain protein 1A [Schistosoma japonicum]TNN11895.1 PHD and RING finger domain-containing protein isoform 2 [Schistosoma japonicum]
MLDFLNLKKSEYLCELCHGIIKEENCTPKSCTHMFHISCLEDWAYDIDSSSEFTCPVSGCSLSFTEIIIRKTPGATGFTLTSFKENHQCPICCERIRKPVATPESCNHSFCYICLKEWSRVRHECPLDRGAYELILLSDWVGGPIKKRVNAPPVKQQLSETPPLELDVNCEVCHRPDDEAHLLLCDHCDRGYHTYCLPTPLSSIPDGDWFCPECFRQGIVPPDEITTNRASTTTDRRVQRNTRRRLIDSEAEESERDEVNNSLDSSSENLYLTHELSCTAQRRLEEQATRRHRGRRLLQDLIADLSERISSEASVRARRRHSQRLRVRNQLASESAGLGTSVSTNGQTTICFEISSSTNQPVSIRLGRPPANSNQNPNTLRSECNGQVSVDNQLEGCRKRLRILSSSDSESDDQDGVILRNSRLTGYHSRLLRSPSESEVEDSPILSGPSSSNHTKRIRGTDATTKTSGTSPEEDILRSAIPESSHINFIQNTALESLHRESDSERSDFKETFVSVVKNTQKKTKAARKKSKRRLPNKVKRKYVKKKPIKSKKFQRSRRKMHRKIRKLSSSSSSISPKSSTYQFRVRNGLIGSSLPKLSILGKESQCDFRLLVEDDETLKSPPVTTTNSASDTSVRQPNPRSSTYLSDIEAGQASLFRFSTRHMQVNPDHSMSPIPVAKHPSPPTDKISASNSVTTEFSSVSTDNSISPFSGANSIPSATKTLLSSNPATNSQIRYSSAASAKCSIITNPTPSTSHNCSSEPNLSHSDWDPESLLRVKSTLKHHLKAYVASHRIDKETCRDIFQRSLGKVIMLSFFHEFLNFHIFM